jgi:hypothetical protein
LRLINRDIMQSSADTQLSMSRSWKPKIRMFLDPAKLGRAAPIL